MRVVAPEARERQPHRMARGDEHRAEQNRHVVAVAGTQLQHSTRGVQRLDLEDVACVADVSAHPLEQRRDLAVTMLRRDAGNAEDLDRLLAHQKVLRALEHQSADDARRSQRSRLAAWHTENEDARRNESWT